MSEPIKDGGPAFPSTWHPTNDGYERGDCGMSLRDYFAGQALTRTQSNDAEDTEADQAALAMWAYAVADAMLKAREAQ